MQKLRGLFTFFLVFFVSNSAWACPGCIGTGGEERDLYVVYTIMGFIVLVYIPMFLVYKVISKNRNSHLIGREQEESSSL